MNHITKLQNNSTENAAELVSLKCGLKDLSSYLTSKKFSTDTTVQAKDVLRRIAEVIQDAADLRADQEYMNFQNERNKTLLSQKIGA